MLAWLDAALAFRGAGTWGGMPAAVLAGAVLQALAFLALAARVWRSLDPPPLGPLRRHLAASCGWIAAVRRN